MHIVIGLYLLFATPHWFVALLVLCMLKDND